MPKTRSAAGSLHLFDRRRVRAFRRDGHAWQKKGGSQTVREAHEKLKVGSETLINAYYCSREDAPRFQRRCYWLLDGDEGMVLVHYLDSGGGASGPGGVPEVAVRPPRRAAAAAAAAAFAAARAAGRDESGEDGGSSGEDDGGDSGSDADASDASAGVAPQPRAPPPQAPQAQAHGHAAGLDPWDGLSLPWLDADLEAVLCAPPPAAASRPAKRAAPEQRAWPVASALAAPQQQQQQQQLQAKLLDYAPRGDAAAGGSRMLLVLAGGMVSGPIVALFDRCVLLIRPCFSHRCSIASDIRHRPFSPVLQRGGAYAVGCAGRACVRGAAALCRRHGGAGARDAARGAAGRAPADAVCAAVRAGAVHVPRRGCCAGGAVLAVRLLCAAAAGARRRVDAPRSARRIEARHLLTLICFNEVAGHAKARSVAAALSLQALQNGGARRKLV